MMHGTIPISIFQMWHLSMKLRLSRRDDISVDDPVNQLFKMIVVFLLICVINLCLV